LSIHIRPVTADDHPSIRHIAQSAFAGTDEVKLVDALRTGGWVIAELVAEVDDQIVGHVLFSRIALATQTRRISLVSLAPVAVLPDYQKQGIGSRLIRSGLKQLQDQGESVVVVLGHPEYYPRFGFSAELAQSLHSPFSGKPAWMALEIHSGALKDIQGQVEYSPPFSAFD
jgi:putative acetyltransferase